MRLVAQWPRLLGHILRRDKVFLPVWIIAVALFCTVFVPFIDEIAGTPEQMSVLAEMMKNPAMVAMCGIMYSDDYTIGVMYTQLMIVWSALLVAVMNILIVIRHTRTDEDEGRLEVIRALPVGRLANLAAVGVLMIAINLVLSVVTGFGMAAFGVVTIDLAGSLVYAAALGACGLFFAALTMFVVQVFHSGRSATGFALAALGALYLIRAYGDVSSETVANLSPLGLMQRTKPFVTNDWWPVVVMVVVSLALMTLGLVLNRLRDLGAGLLPQLRSRRVHASAFLSGEWGLTWRLTRGTIVAWLITVFVFSAAYGTVMGDMQSFVNSSPLYQHMIGVDPSSPDIIGPLVTTLSLIIGMIGTIPVLTTAFKLRSEEVRGRMDYVVGKTVSRLRLYAGYAGLAVTVAVVAQVLNAFGFWMVATSVMANPVSISLVFKIAFNYLPALLFLGGLGMFLVGWAKKLTWVGWAYLVASFLVVYMGGMVEVPRWVMRLTPFGLLQRWPLEEFSWWPWIGLMAAAVVLVAGGAFGYRRRDLGTT